MVTKLERPTAARHFRELDVEGPLPADCEIGRRSETRSQIASEVGAAMAHQLSGPMTALLLYIGDLHQKRNQIVDLNGDSGSLKRVIESAFHEAERISRLIHRMGDDFEAPIPKQAAIPIGRDAIAWWSRSGHANGGSLAGAGPRAVDEAGRAGLRPLTPREREVLLLVSLGCSNKEGAKQMNISYRTFECHRAEVMRKLGAKNTAELVRLALLDVSGPGGAPGPSGM